MYLRDFLQQSGAFVIMTREEDKDLASPEADLAKRRKAEDIRNRVKLVNDSSPDFWSAFTSIPYRLPNGRERKRFTRLRLKKRGSILSDSG